jgi:hypothetical protein
MSKTKKDDDLKIITLTEQFGKDKKNNKPKINKNYNKEKDYNKEDNNNYSESSKNNDNIQCKSFTERLSKKEIEDMVLDYEQTDIKDIQIGTDVRYFVRDKNGEMHFRMGGTIIVKSLPKYVILSNGGKTWSVQVKGTTFLSKLNIIKIKNEYDMKINELTESIKTYKLERNKLKKLAIEQNEYIKKQDKIIKDLENKLKKK